VPVSFCLLHNTTLLSPWKTKADKGGRALVRPLGPLCKSFALTHGIRAANDDGIGIMDDSVADSVRQEWPRRFSGANRLPQTVRRKWWMLSCSALPRFPADLWLQSP